MLRLLLPKPKNSAYRVLCLGAHSDDIEIGCGGTILRLLEQQKNTVVRWVVFSSSPARAEEARQSADAFLSKAASREIVVKKFRDGFFPYTGGEVKDFFETLKPFAPDVIFTHYRNDLHQDHRMLCELTWNTFRDHMVLEYEIPKFDGDLGSPNFFVELDDATCHRKAQYLMENFKTQRDKHWFSEETFRAILRVRGVECRASTGYAEAFYARKIVLG